MKYILLLLSLVLTTHFSMAQTVAGDFDTSFGNNGRSRTSFSDSPDFLYAAVMQPDGKTIAVGGTETIVEGGIVTYHIVIARYLDNGNVDPGFGVNGIQTLLLDEVGAYALSVALQADGKILLTGTSDLGVFSPTAPRWQFRYYLWHKRLCYFGFRYWIFNFSTAR